MSWNIAKPGDQINGPVSITGALTSSSTISGTQIISTVATGTAPLTVASTTNVTNLNADLLDGQQGSYYQSADNINAGTLVVGRGGTGASTFTAGRVLFGNGTSALNTSANLFWDNSNNRLGIGTATPRFTLDASGDIAIPLNSKVYAYYATATNYASFGANNSGNIELTTGTSSPAVRQTIAADGVCTWSNVGGVAGTAMTLNGTGLSIGGSIFSNSKLTLVSAAGVDCMLALQKTGGSNTSVMMTDGTNAWLGSSSGSTGKKLIYALAAPDNSVVVDSSGNVGINTTSPAYKLHVSGDAKVNNLLWFTPSSGLMAVGCSGTNFQIYNGSGAETRLTVDSSGNVGINTTTPAYKLDVINANVSGTSWSGIRYRDTSVNCEGYVGVYNSVVQVGATSNHPLDLYAGGSNRVRIDTSGNVGIGTTTPLFKLDVRGGSIYVERSSNPTNGTLIQASNQTTTSNNGCKISFDSYNIGAAGAGVPSGAQALAFYVGGVADANEKARIDTAGNLGLGVTPQSNWGTAIGFKAIELAAGNLNCYLTDYLMLGQNCYSNASGVRTRINNGYASEYQQTSGKHIWKTVGTGNAGTTFTFTDAMTLDASGNLLVGTASSAGLFKAEVTSANSTGAFAMKLNTASSTSSALQVYVSGNRSSDTTYYIINAGDDSSARFRVFGNGNVVNINGSYGTISDLSLKENISNARNYLEDILKLRVVKYSLKSEASSVATKLGMIAQEVEEVFPSLIDMDSDGKKSIKTSVFIPMILKAIQELTARVQTLENA